MAIKLTRELAFAASLDAGNRSMYLAKRTAWSEEDADAAANEFNRLWPLCVHGAEPQDCRMCLGVEQNRTSIRMYP